jgi:hypothetical protein
MLKNKLAFLLAGLINNYNFIVIFSCAYSLSKLNPYINPSFIILCEIIPGFITQLLYTKYLYQINYTYRWILLFIIQILSSLFLIIQYDKIPFLFTSIALVSIYTYLGESSMLSISSFYEQKEMKFWSIGTGLARVCGTGFYLIMDRWLDMRIIFGINLLIYLLGFSISLYLLDYRNKINTKKEEVDPTPSTELNTVPLEDFDLSQNEITKVPIPIWKKHIQFFLDIHFLAVAYFLSYFLGFAYIPLLVKSDFEYQICQFITGISIFLGRTIGNYIKIEKINIFSLLHLYSFLSIIIFTVSIIYKIQIPLLIINLMLIITYLINGISYPIVYNYVYKNYTEEKSWYMGAVGQYTSLFMIIGCILGYPLQFLFKNS